MSSLSLASRPVLAHDVGVSSTRSRRRFTTAFKLQILEEAARCVAPGALGALLRREGLYSSHLSVWRAAAKRGELTGPTRRRGPKAAPPDPRTHQILVLERALAKATARAEHAEALVDLQKKWRSCSADLSRRPTGRTGHADGRRAYAPRPPAGSPSLRGARGGAGHLLSRVAPSGPPSSRPRTSRGRIASSATTPCPPHSRRRRGLIHPNSSSPQRTYFSNLHPPGVSNSLTGSEVPTEDHIA